MEYAYSGFLIGTLIQDLPSWKKVARLIAYEGDHFGYIIIVDGVPQYLNRRARDILDIDIKNTQDCLLDNIDSEVVQKIIQSLKASSEDEFLGSHIITRPFFKKKLIKVTPMHVSINGGGPYSFFLLSEQEERSLNIATVYRRKKKPTEANPIISLMEA